MFWGEKTEWIGARRSLKSENIFWSNGQYFCFTGRTRWEKRGESDILNEK